LGELDLDKPSTFRDLTKPTRALNPERLNYFKQWMQSMPAPDPAGGVSSPSLSSITAPELTGTASAAADLQGMIPDFLGAEAEDLDLGHLQTGERLGDVVLPHWADSPRGFIRKHAKALQSEYASDRLHHWIDLIFGYKQQGAAALEADNLYYSLTYEGVVDLDQVRDSRERDALVPQIQEFGQTPKQLFRSPHPCRNSKLKDDAPYELAVDSASPFLSTPPSRTDQIEESVHPKPLERRHTSTEACKRTACYGGTLLGRSVSRHRRPSYFELRALQDAALAPDAGDQGLLDVAQGFEAFAAEHLSSQKPVPKKYVASTVKGNVSVEATMYKCRLPTSMYSKQEAMSAPNVELHRTGALSLAQEAAVADLLGRGRSVVVVGSPGIGKSTSANRVYLSQVDALKAGRVKLVFLRVDQELFVASYRNNTGRVEVEFLSEAPEGGINSHLGFISRLQLSGRYAEMLGPHPRTADTVFLVEMTEEELSSGQSSLERRRNVCLILWASNRNIEGLVKAGHTKSGRLTVLLCDPMSSEEVLLSATAMADLQFETCAFARSGAYGDTLLTKEEAIERVAARIREVGPNLRVVTSDEKTYEAYCMGMMPNAKLQGLANRLDMISLYTMPERGSLFFVPHAKAHVTIPDVALTYRLAAPGFYEERNEPSSPASLLTAEDWGKPMYEFDFASNLALARIQQYITTDAHVQALRDSGLYSAGQERISALGLCLTSGSQFDADFERHRWEVTLDPGALIDVTEEMVLAEPHRTEFLSLLRQCDTTKLFSGAVNKVDLDNMTTGALCVPWGINDPMLLGDKEMKISATVLAVIQDSRTDPTEHDADVTSVIRVLEAHGCGEHSPAGRKMLLVYFLDWATESPRGIAFRLPCLQGSFRIGLPEWRARAKARALLLSDVETPEPPGPRDRIPSPNYDWVMDRLETVIVRGKVFKPYKPLQHHLTGKNLDAVAQRFPGLWKKGEKPDAKR
jgi:hypothetical protein